MKWKNLAEAGGVALLGGFPIGHRIGREEEREHRADAIDGDAGRRPRGQLRGARFQLIVDLRMREQMPQHRQPRRHRQRIARIAFPPDRPGPSGATLRMMSARPP